MNYLWDYSTSGPELPQEDNHMPLDAEKEGVDTVFHGAEEIFWLQLFFLYLKLECKRYMPVSAAGKCSRKICLDGSDHMCWPRVMGVVLVGQQRQLGEVLRLEKQVTMHSSSM